MAAHRASVAIAGDVIHYSYNALTRTGYPDGTQTLSVYDALNRAVWTTNSYDPNDPAGVVLATHTIYNQLGQVVETDQYENTVITITPTLVGGTYYDEAALVSPGTLYSSIKTLFNAAGQAVETISPSGLRTGTIYYPDGQAEYTGPLRADVFDSGPDAWFNNVPSSITTAYLSGTNGLFNYYTTNEYDLVNPSPVNAQLVLYDATIDANGNETDTYKDALGRVVRTVYADGSFTETLYSVGSTPVTKDEEGVALSIPTGLTVPAGDTEEVQIAQRKSGDPIVATFDIYDAAGNLIDVWQPAVADGDNGGTMTSPHWQYVYDSSGNEIAQISPTEEAAYQTWNTDHDSSTAFSGTTGFTYFAYDEMGDMVKRTLPDGESESYTYDEFGNEATHTDFDGNVATYTYFTSGADAEMIEDVVYGAASGSGKTPQTVAYTYNALGQEETVSDASGTTTYSYDIFGNQIQAQTPEGTINYVYDPATGNLIETWTGSIYAGAMTDAS